MLLLVYVSAIILITLCVVISSLRRHVSRIYFSVLGIFFVRVPLLFNNKMTWQHDSIYYYSISKAVYESHHLTIPDNSTASVWASTSERVNLFLLHIPTVAVKYVTELPDPIVRLGLPLIFPLVIFLFTYLIFSQIVDRRYALIGAYLYAQTETSIYYTVEYHQFTISATIFVILVYLLLFKSLNYRTVVLWILFSVSFSISHTIMPLIGFVILFVSSFVLYLIDIDPRSYTPTRELHDHLRYLSILGGFVAISYIYWYMYTFNLVVFKSIGVFLGDFGSSFNKNPTIQNRGGKSIIDQFALLFKILLVTLSVPTVYKAVASRDMISKDQKKIVALIFSTGVAGVLGVLVTPSSIIRIVLLAYLSLIGCTLVTVYDIHIPFEKPVMSVSMAILVVGASLYGATPSLVDPTSDVRADGYHKVEPISRDQAKKGGDFIHQYYNGDPPITTRFRVNVVVNYYGGEPYEDLITSARGKRMTVFDDNRNGKAPATHSRIYSNQRIVISIGNYGV